MFDIVLESRNFTEKYLLSELSSFLEIKTNDIRKIDEGVFVISVCDQNELIKFVYKIFFCSRFVQRVYLKIGEFDNYKMNEFSFCEDFDFLNLNLKFKIECGISYNLKKEESKIFFGNLINSKFKSLSVDLKNPDIIFKLFNFEYKKKDRQEKEKENNQDKTSSYLFLDLIGFDLTKRDYKLNSNSNSFNTILSNYAFKLIELDKENLEKTGVLVMDPFANLGDLIIEASLFVNKKCLNVRKKYKILVAKIFSNDEHFVKEVQQIQEEVEGKEEKDLKHKFLGVVQNNKIFKLCRENISFSSEKIKLSQYDFDWIDVKFKKDSVDYIVSYIPSFKSKKDEDEFCLELFYQAEFVLKKKMALICKQEVSLKYIKKNNLVVKEKDKVFIGEQMYLIYSIVCKNKED